MAAPSTFAVGSTTASVRIYPHNFSRFGRVKDTCEAAKASSSGSSSSFSFTTFSPSCKIRSRNSSSSRFSFIPNAFQSSLSRTLCSIHLLSSFDSRVDGWMDGHSTARTVLHSFASLLHSLMHQWCITSIDIMSVVHSACALTVENSQISFSVDIEIECE